MVKLVSVTVENFRSITKARNIPISGLTTLVGPNNEGKSNFLRAMVTAMNLLVDRRGRISHTVPRRSRYLRNRQQLPGRYDWEQDFPVRLQSKKPDGGSVITLEFELSSREVAEFQGAVGSSLNGTLPMSLVLKRASASVSISKPGRGQKSLNSKAERIADFLAERIDIQYIPAVRTAEFAQSIVEDLVRAELAKVEADPKYKEALEEIAALQEPILRSLSESITDTMRIFLPHIARAKIVIPESERSVALRDISEILLDDGVETSLVSKGDGVQSLAAIALMRHSSKSAHEGKHILIALEEPESHLHPNAVRQLRTVLAELSDRYQVVITTHSPIFTNRLNIYQNIIVKRSKAAPARTVKDVREALGVRVDDNLSSAEVVLIVEGEEDRIALTSILQSLDETLAQNLKAGRLGIDVLGGASNLAHRIRLHTEAVGKVHAFLDDDQAGRNAFEAARREGLLDTSGVNFTMVGGKTEAELEDLDDQSVFDETIRAEVGLSWEGRGTDGAKKWADRLRNLLRQAGRPHDENVVQMIKIKVAQAAAALGSAALHPSKVGPVESLKTALLSKLSSQ